MTEYNMSDEIFGFLCMEPFFADISIEMGKIPTRSVPTLGVRLNPREQRFELIYNPDFVGKLAKLHRKGVIFHEFCHIGFGHCGTRYNPKIPHKIQNIAMDLAINGLPGIKEMLPLDVDLPGFVNEKGEPEKFSVCMPGHGQFKHLPPEESYEFYLAALMKMAKGGGEPGDSHDAHDWADGIPEGMTEAEYKQANRIARKKMTDAVKRAAKLAQKREKQTHGARGWGSVPQKARDYIIEAIKAMPPPPEEVLNHFISGVTKGWPLRRWTKRNRRMPWMKPGRRYKELPKILIMIDQSGSVSDQLLGVFAHFLNKFASVIEFDVGYFDTEVSENIWTWEKGKVITKMVREREGGTDFNAPTRFVNQSRDYDGLIICSDMECYFPQHCNVPRLWVTDDDGGERAAAEGWRERVMTIGVADIERIQKKV